MTNGWWLERWRRYWEQRFNRLDDYLREIQAAERHRNNGRADYPRPGDDHD